MSIEYGKQWCIRVKIQCTNVSVLQFTNKTDKTQWYSIECENNERRTDGVSTKAVKKEEKREDGGGEGVSEKGRVLNGVNEKVHVV